MDMFELNIPPADNHEAVSTADILASSILSSISPDTNEFQWDKFFRLWFRENGSSVFFLFKKNLGVTNVQYAELFALIREHCQRDGETDRRQELLFYSTEEMKEFVVESLNTLLDVTTKEAGENNERIRRFAEQYRDIFDRSLVVDMFYTSCAVFLPIPLTLDVAQVCADSGYIHSGGKSIFVRNIRKAKIYDFEDSLKQHLKTRVGELPIPFVVYAHEDFSEWDKHSKDEISRGIDEVKMHLEKMSMSRHRLPTILSALRKQFAKQLIIPDAGPYSEKHKFDSDRCLFLIADRSVSFASPERPGADRYYICYEQAIKNENPFYFFDENKPAWKSHTTMPHSLTAALLNTTRPFANESVVIDPFGGTGTTWFEVKRLGLKCRVECSDLSPISNLLIQDNLDFFLLSSVELRSLNAEIDDILEYVRRDQGRVLENTAQSSLFPEGAISTPFLVAIRLLNELQTQQPEENQEYSFDEKILSQLRELPSISRMMFYVALRAKLRFPGAHARKSRSFSALFVHSLEELRSQIGHLEKVRALAEKSTITSGSNFVRFRENYSDAVFPAFLWNGVGKQTPNLRYEVLTRDARNLKPNSVDVILCDPPYGFNTSEDQLILSDLYSEFITAAVGALRHRGHLIICLPSESFTGQDLPFCTRSGLITGQVLSAARKIGKHIFRPARLIPNNRFSPPYYWEAEKALRRTILHFRIGTTPDQLNHTDIDELQI